jgi:ribonuclease Z
MNLEVFVLGTGGMMPLPGRGLTSVLVRREGDLFLFDCGEGTQIGLRRLNLRWKKITSIFISHTHADHVTGLPGILMLSSQVDRAEPLYIYGPPKIREFIEAMRRTLDMYINYEIIVREIEGGTTIVRAEEYTICSHSLVHTKPCLAYSLVEKVRPGIFFPEKALALGVPRGPLWSKLQGGEDVHLPGGGVVTPSQVMGDERKGRKFCFATDTIAAPGLVEFARKSDLFICEGMFAEELAETAAEKRHLTAAQAARIARESGVKRLGLIHYSPRYSERELKTLLGEAREIFPESFLTRDLQHIELPFED